MSTCSPLLSPSRSDLFPPTTASLLLPPHPLHSHGTFDKLAHFLEFPPTLTFSPLCFFVPLSCWISLVVNDHGCLLSCVPNLLLYKTPGFACSVAHVQTECHALLPNWAWPPSFGFSVCFETNFVSKMRLSSRNATCPLQFPCTASFTLAQLLHPSTNHSLNPLPPSTGAVWPSGSHGTFLRAHLLHYCYHGMDI